VWLECHEGGHGVLGGSPVLQVPDNVDVAEVHAIEAADRQHDGTDRFRRQTDVDLQLSTFSGTKVRRSGSVWPSATSRPSVS